MGYFSELAIDQPLNARYCDVCDQPLTAGRCSWCQPAALAAAPPPALPRCPCGRILGSAFCRCGRIFSSVVPRALGSGARAVIAAPSQHAPSGLVARCAFPVWSQAVSFARACPALFGVVPPLVRHIGSAWVVSVPISSRW